MAAVAVLRVLPERHQLRGRCRQASHYGMSMITSGVFRTVIVVRIALVPLRLDEVSGASAAVARDELAGLLEHLPVRGDVRRRGITRHPVNAATFNDAVEIIL